MSDKSERIKQSHNADLIRRVQGQQDDSIKRIMGEVELTLPLDDGRRKHIGKVQTR